MSIQDEIELLLQTEQMDFVRFIPIDDLTQNKGYHSAVWFGKALSPEYMKAVAANPNYVQEMKQAGTRKQDEFYLTELATDALADKLAKYIRQRGFDACSQSEKNVDANGDYNAQYRSSTLPHKTIALRSGLGWIGKNNLLVTPEYGCAISMCTVLTNAPLQTERYDVLASQCGDCTICRDICSADALKGQTWKFGMKRSKLVDVFFCNPCGQCMAQCPYTKRYARQQLALLTK